MAPGVREFSSKQEVLEHWHQLLSLSEGSSPASLCAHEELALSPSDDVRYVVSPATVFDTEAIGELAEEFVRSQRGLFDRQYAEVDRKTWCEYLGVHADLQKRSKFLMDGARKTAERRRSPRYSMAWCNGGWTLKCERHTRELQRAASECSSAVSSKVPRTAAGTSGSATSSSSSAGAAGVPRRCSSRSSLLSKPEVVGYIHITLQEGASSSGVLRRSKRLKKSRGEGTGEYLKVHQLLVTESCRGEGLGALLLASALTRVRLHDPTYAREIFLTVIEKNTSAVGLYQHLGFRIMGQNITYLGQVKKRPVSWMQMILEPGIEAGVDDTDERERVSEEDLSTTASSAPTPVGRRVRRKIASDCRAEQTSNQRRSGSSGRVSVELN